MELATFWFLLIAVLWIGYFVLEGFDFGVGINLYGLARDEPDRRVLINSIGPVWDGNEVWLITAGGATFAAFPEWYASMFSGFYIPLLLILLALIVRGVAFEYRGKRDDDRWRARWTAAIFIGSLVPAALWGVAFANIVQGVPMDADHIVTASLIDLLNAYALLGGLTTVLLFWLHGTVFLALKTEGEIRERAHALALRLGPAAVASGGLFLLWTQLAHGKGWTWVPVVLAAACLVFVNLGVLARRDGWAFTAGAAAITLSVVALFGSLWPMVLPSTTDPSYGLTVDVAASSPYTLTLMSWVAVVFTPIVLAYQGWTYWVFRKRLSRKAFEPQP